MDLAIRLSLAYNEKGRLEPSTSVTYVSRMGRDLVTVGPLCTRSLLIVNAVVTHDLFHFHSSSYKHPVIKLSAISLLLKPPQVILQVYNPFLNRTRHHQGGYLQSWSVCSLPGQLHRVHVRYQIPCTRRMAVGGVACCSCSPRRYQREERLKRGWRC